MSEAKVIARNLRKQYGTVVAVTNVSLAVEAGQILGILGPNGAGKTTALEIMEGIRQPDGGTCHICGYDTVKESRQVRERIGISFQQTSLPDDVTVTEMLRLYASFYANPIPPGDLLAQFDLREKAKARAKRLSGGQRQRLALALALIGRPEVIFVDEPTTGLDPQSRRSLWDAILSLKADGRAIIMTTHYMEEAERLCDRVIVMDRGAILAQGTPRELMREYGPESAIELEAQDLPLDLADLSRLQAVTGVRREEGALLLHSANTAITLMDLAQYAQQTSLPLNGLKTRSASMEDVFISLTGRGLRE
jgi:ABC-2 type transport system ATP-binding protein